MVRMKFQPWNVVVRNNKPKTISSAFLHIFLAIIIFVWVPVTAIKRSVIHSRNHVNKVHIIILHGKEWKEKTNLRPLTARETKFTFIINIFQIIIIIICFTSKLQFRSNLFIFLLYYSPPLFDFVCLRHKPPGIH